MRVALLLLLIAGLMVYGWAVGPGFPWRTSAEEATGTGSGPSVENGASPTLKGAGRGADPASPASEGDGAQERHSTWPHDIRVTEETTGQPIEGATVSVWLEMGQTTERIAVGVSDKTGVVQADLSALAQYTSAQLGVATLRAFAYAPGHYMQLGCPRSVRALLTDTLDPKEISLKIEMARGAIIRGRVVDETGAPASQQLVWLRLPKGAPRSEVWLRTYTDFDGQYALPAPGTGPYRVSSSLRRATSGASTAVDVPPNADVAAELLIVPMPDRVTGSLAFPNGTPVADMTIYFHHPDMQVHRTQWSPRNGPIIARTDARGVFHAALPELRPSGYMKRHPQLLEKFEYSLVLPGMRAIPLGTHPRAETLRLTVDRHLVRLQVRDEAGEALRAMPVQPSWSDAWFAGQEVITDDRGEAALFVPRGSSGAASLVRAGGAPLSVTISAGPENESRVLVDVPAPEPPGWVRFVNAAEHSLAPDFFDVRIRTASGIVMKNGIEFSSYEERIPLAPGPYKLSVSGSLGGRWSRHYTYAASQQLIEIQSGEELAMPLSWRATARLSITANVGGEATHVENLSVVARDAQGKTVWRSLARSMGVDDQTRRFVWKPRRGLEPGVQPLVIRAQGYEAVKTRVRLVHDELSNIEILLVPKED